MVHPANIQDRDGAKLVLQKIAHAFLKLRLIWADGGYAGRLIEWVYQIRRRGKVTLASIEQGTCRDLGLPQDATSIDGR